MYIVYIPQCQKAKEKKQALFLSFLMVSSVKSTLILLFNMSQVLEKAISWSMTVYNKNSSSQYNLTAKIEPVQDKHLYTCIQVSGIPCEDYFRHMWVISVILLLACDRSLTSSSEKLTNVDINS